MKTLHFSTTIKAPVQKVWHIMLNPETYKKWTTPFSEGSTYQGAWDKGAEIKFVDPNGDGMYARIEENKPFEFISIKHLGVINKGVIDTESQEVKEWTPALENYSFDYSDGYTKLSVRLDSHDKYVEMFNDMWPKALAKLKEICENPSKKLTVSTIINAPVDKVWEMRTNPEHIKGWAFASPDWGVGKVTNDLKVNGRFSTEMKANDGSFAFDYAGTYIKVEPQKYMLFVLDDGRTVESTYIAGGETTKVTETFEMEHENSEELQLKGWQGILDTFKKYVETH
jgi:uncharacterized protein YndB with AHSA1/START domain